MTSTRQPRNRRQRTVVICLSIGIPLVALALLILGFRAITAPKHFAVLQYGDADCAVSTGGRSVFVQMALREHDDTPELDTVEVLGARDAHVVASGWLTPPVGYALDETRPSRTELSKAFSGSDHDRPLPAKRSNLVLQIAVDPSGSASMRGVDILIDNGEPSFYQTLIFNLSMAKGHCSVDHG